MNKMRKLFIVLLAVMMVVTICIVFTACKETKSLTGLKYENGKLSWNADSVAGAVKDSYEVFVDGVKKNLSASEDGKILSLDLTDETNGDKDFDVTVKAKGEDGALEQTINFKKLPALTVDIANGCFDWSESAKAYAGYGNMVYDIVLDGKTMGSVETTSYKTNTGALHTIVVRPRVASATAFFFSDWSQEKTTSVLSTPIITDCKFTVERDSANKATKASAIIEWTGVTFFGGNPTYKLWINDVECDSTTTSFDTATITDENFSAINGITVTLQAITNLENVASSAVSEARSFISLAPVTGLAVENGLLIFDEVENAASYLVKYDGKEVETDTNSILLETASTSITASVCALPSTGFEAARNWADVPESFNILTAPSIRYESKMFIIGGDKANVGQYEVIIDKVNKDGEVIETVFSERQDSSKFIFNSYDFGGEGRYTIKVRSIANSPNYFDSVFCAPYTITRLGKIPGVSIEDIPASTEAQSYLKITIDEVKDYSEEVDRYKLFMDGTQISSTSMRVFEVPKPTTFDERTYKFSVQAISDDNGNDSSITLSSLEKVEFNILKMAAPRNISLVENGSVTWTQPEPKAAVLKNTETGLVGFGILMLQGYSVGPDDRSFSFPGSLAAGIINVKVYAKSAMTLKSALNYDVIRVKFSEKSENNTITKVTEVELAEGKTKELAEGTALVLGSDYSNPTQFRKLSRPTDFVIRNEILQWAPVEDSQGYNVLYSSENGQGVLATVNDANFEFKRENVNPEALSAYDQLISDKGCAIQVVALGNKNEDLENGEMYTFDSEPSLIQTVFKLDQPNGVQVSNDYLSWNEVPYATAYAVYYNEVLQGNVSTTSFSIAEFDSDIYYIKIKALGDSVKYFDSEPSDEFVFEKLNKMAITVKGGLYRWKAVPHAQIYNFVIDGKDFSVEADFEAEANAGPEGYYYTLKPLFNHADNLQVSYTTIGMNGDIDADYIFVSNGQAANIPMPTVSSATTTFFQPVERLNTPQLAPNANGAFNIVSEAGRIIITANIITDARATGYVFRIGGTEYNSDSLSYKYVENAEHGERRVEVAYKANVFEGAENDEIAYVAGTTKYLLNSEYCPSTSNFNYLRDVYDIEVTGINNSYTVRWKNIIGARYQYYFELYNTVSNGPGKYIIDETKSNAIYASTIETSTDYTKTFELSDCLPNYVYNKDVVYGIKFYITVVGNNTSTVSDYTIIEISKTGLR